MYNTAVLYSPPHSIFLFTAVSSSTSVSFFFFPFLFNCRLCAGKMAPWLKAHTAHTEDSHLISGSHFEQLKTACIYSSRGDPMSLPSSALILMNVYTHSVCVNMCEYVYTHIHMHPHTWNSRLCERKTCDTSFSESDSPLHSHFQFHHLSASNLMSFFTAKPYCVLSLHLLVGV